MSLIDPKFLSYYRPYRGLLAGDLACAALVSAINLSLPLCVRAVTHAALSPSDPASMHRIVWFSLLMLGLIAAHAVCIMFVDYRGHLMGAKMENDMRSELFDRYQSLSFRFFDRNRTGQLMTRLTNDLLSLAEFYHHGPEDLVIGVVTILGVLGVSLAINPGLTLIVLPFLAAMIAYAFYFHRRAEAAMRHSHARIGDINAQVEDTLSGIRVVQSFTNEPVEQSKFRVANHRFLDSRADVYRSSAWFSTGLIVGTQLITLAVVFAGGRSIVGGEMVLPDLLTYLLYVGILVEPIQRLVNFGRLYQEGTTGFARFREMLRVEPEIVDAPDAHELERVAGDIEFREVSFRYHEEHDLILRNINLHIRPGEFVALVGPSGVGKSTMCSLIPRFYDSNAGAVRIDGHDVRDVTLQSLRSNVGVVHQDVYLFAGTVAENIRYGRPGATDEEVVEAATRANAHEFICGFSEGYRTEVGQRGITLSGGQKQRISIARAFLKGAPIIIFDEATSSLDNASERAIQDSLERLAAHRTMIVIAHRLSTVRKADRIVVLGEHGIEEDGTHEELIAANGMYAELYRLQLEI